MKKLLLACFCLLLSACAAHHRQSNELANQLYQQSPEVVLALLQADQPEPRDIVQYQLNAGLLQLLSADLNGAIDSLSAAKLEMQRLSALSVTETAAAATVSETLRRYSGSPTDRVMVHNLLALSYLFWGDIDGARVEMLQADVVMKQLATKDSLSGQLASTHLLSGIIYELLDEQSNALISYRNSEQIVKQRQLGVAPALQQALLRTSYSVDRKGQYQHYLSLYPHHGDVPPLRDQSQIFALYFDGVISNKDQTGILIPSGNGEQLIRISMPVYQQPNYRITHARLSSAEQQVRSALIENLETSAREDLAADYPSILLLTSTRAVAKYNLVGAADKQDPLLGALVNLATILTEAADLRSWNMLPSNIQFAYLQTQANEIHVDRGNGNAQTLSIQDHSQNVLLISNLDTPLFHYQQ